ncbi:MAG TPA: DUF3467 domain-containing protein [Actinomycetes bacterium]|nr:DUF3467 domain-containing protein [Actinomycetes bacterium]
MADEPRFAIEVPDEARAGSYADFVSIWHTGDTFILDFAALVAPAEQVEDDGTTYLQSTARVVSRVRIPPSQVFEIMRALELQLSQWESEHGRRPGGQPG